MAQQRIFFAIIPLRGWLAHITNSFQHSRIEIVCSTICDIPGSLTMFHPPFSSQPRIKLFQHDRAAPLRINATIRFHDMRQIRRSTGVPLHLKRLPWKSYIFNSVSENIFSIFLTKNHQKTFTLGMSGVFKGMKKGSPKEKPSQTQSFNDIDRSRLKRSIPHCVP